MISSSSSSSVVNVILLSIKLLIWMNVFIINYHGIVVLAEELPLSVMSAAASGMATPVMMNNTTTNTNTTISTILEGNNATTITSTKVNNDEERKQEEEEEKEVLLVEKEEVKVNVDKFIKQVQEQQQQQQRQHVSSSTSSCRLYLAPKLHQPNKEKKILTFYSGIEHKAYEIPMMGTSIQDAIVMTLVGVNHNEYSPWYDYVWGSAAFFYNDTNALHLDGRYDHEYDILMSGNSGFGTILACNEAEDYKSNVKNSIGRYGNDDNFVHNSSKKHTYTMSTIRDISIGEELLLDCSMTSLQDIMVSILQEQQDETDENDNDRPRMIASIEYLEEYGLCMDTIDQFEVRSLSSSSVEADVIDHDHHEEQYQTNGLFAKRSFDHGEVVTISPVIHFDRSQMNIIQRYYPNDINNGYDSTLPNFRDDEITEYPIPIQYKASIVLGQYNMLNYCYGHEHSNMLLFPYGNGVNYIRHNGQEPNIYIRWSNHSVFDHIHYDLRERITYHNVSSIIDSLPFMDLFETSDIKLSIEYVTLRHIMPGEELVLDYGIHWNHAYQEYINNKTDNKEFRHEIRVPNHLYPNHWMRYEEQDNTKLIKQKVKDNDFIANSLKPGYIVPVRWSSNQEIVSPWVFRIGLPSKFHEILLQYCNVTGITKLLNHVTKDGNSLEPDQEEYVTLPNNLTEQYQTTYHNNETWYLQRPGARWRSNLHWLSPGNSNTHESYLQVLSSTGFDSILESIGEYFNMEGLVVYQVTFIGVSHATKGFVHTDFTNTQHKAYNIIIPLILAEHTDPELDIEAGMIGYDDEVDELNEELKKPRHIGRYQYEYDVGIMIGDYVNHGTSSVDYRHHHEMRLAATIYVADINDNNVDNIMNYFTQAYPPVDRELMLSWSSKHWSKNNNNNNNNTKPSLPKPNPKHIISILNNQQQQSNNNEDEAVVSDDFMSDTL